MVTFSQGETSAKVQVPITDDSLVEETATMLTSDSNVMFGDPTAIISILDNDG